jgi:hypothetical protein
MEDKSLSSDVETSLFEELEDQFIAMLEDSSSLYEESSVQFEESSSSFVEESSSHFEESSSFVEESSSHFGESSSFVEESSSHFEESSSFYVEPSSHFEESSSFYVESSSHFEESSSFYVESSSHFEESSSFHEESPSCQNKKKDFNLEFPSTKRILPIAKLSVLLANLDFHIDLFDSIPLQIPIDHITKIDWHIHSFDCQVLLPSPNVVLKGILIADITYVDDASSSLHTVKLNISLNKWMKVNWLYTPKLPSSYQVEYMYRGNENMEVQYHREFSQQFAQPIQSELQNVYIIWHDELISNGILRELDIQGRVQLSMNLLQSQYVDLDALYS